MVTMESPLHSPLRSPLHSAVVSKWGADAYAVLGFSPELVIDAVEDYYRANSSATTFADMVTTTATSNRTMVDSDGVLKWAPHNQVLQSDDVANASWTKLGLETVTGNSSDGFALQPTTVNTSHYVTGALNMTVVAGATYTLSFEAKANGYNFIGFNTTGALGIPNDLASANLSDGTTAAQSGVTLTATTLGDGWYLCDYTFTPTGTGVISIFVYVLTASQDFANFAGDGSSSILVRRPRGYRSDLGGMTANPDRGDSYVPTTSAAVYMPRRGHYRYNGTSWVKAGLLCEPTAATNLVTYSNDFSNAAWTKSDVTIASGAETGPDGLSSLASVTISATTATHSIYTTATVSSGATITQSYWVKAGTQRYVSLREVLDFSTWAAVTFDLQTGTITDTQTAAATVNEKTIENFGSGLYRISMTSTVTGRTLAFNVLEAVNSATPTRAGFGIVSYLGASEIFYAGFAQLEAGSVPSSYIPTSGSTATRAAETVTIAAAKVPYPTAEVIGAELGSDDASDWVGTGGGSVTQDGDWVLITGAAATATGASLELPISQGGVYRWTMEVDLVTATNVDIQITTLLGSGSDAFSPVSYDLITSDKTITFTGVCTDASSPSYLNVQPRGVGQTARVKNVSVQEINPLSLWIQMEGYMTYADTGSGTEVRQIYWYNNSAENIGVYVSTITTRTGEQQFAQTAGSVFDNVASGQTLYSPGINVPFNIASRHGSTFVNGATDGTALTADTTPVALPALSSTNLVLAQSGGPMIISKFRMGTGDIGNAGIEEAST